MPNQPRSVADVFPSKYLNADDLAGKQFKLKIIDVTFVEIHDRYEGNIQKAAVRFEGAKKLLILNKTQALAIAAIIKSDLFEDWKGHHILIRPGRANNGKQTIFIDPVPLSEM